MSNVTNELLHRTLQAIRADIANLAQRVENTERVVLGVARDLNAQRGDTISVEMRNAELTTRLDRVERRLELRDDG